MSRDRFASNKIARRHSESASTRTIAAEGSPRLKRIRTALPRERVDTHDPRRGFIRAPQKRKKPRVFVPRPRRSRQHLGFLPPRPRRSPQRVARADQKSQITSSCKKLHKSQKSAWSRCKNLFFLRFLICPRDPLRGSAWSRCRNSRCLRGSTWSRSKNCRCFCDSCGARAAYCGDRRGRGATTRGFLRFLICPRDALRGSIKLLPWHPRNLNLTYIAANAEALCTWLYALGSMLGSMRLALCTRLYALGSVHSSLCAWLSLHLAL